MSQLKPGTRLRSAVSATEVMVITAPGADVGLTCGGAAMLAEGESAPAGAALDPERVVVVAGHGADLVEAALADREPTPVVVHQAERLGTAHAVAQAREALGGATGDALVLYGDTPFIRAETR